ncbi:MAG TPA: hypothetical protein VHI93_03415, partial [Candidatus Thermoplasmatota archaeon]|nr:hypothetical protein [Candidatus Thermoplasmatota archaeon]
ARASPGAPFAGPAGAAPPAARDPAGPPALLHELDGAALPLLAAVLVALPILVAAWLRDAAPLWLERRRKEDAP